MYTSVLHEYSLGIVKTDVEILDDSVNDEIEIVPIEILSEIDDDLLKPMKIKEQVELITKLYPTIKYTPVKNKPIKITDNEQLELIKENSITATWVGKHQYNRITAPVVRKGEYVKLYRLSNSPIFFWDTLRNDVRWRKEELVIWAFSDKPKVDPNESLDKMYYLKVDTKNKLIKLHTTSEYGEVTTYDITLNTGSGYLEILDGKGNYIKLDSANDDLIVNTNNACNLTTTNTITTNTTNETKNISENLKINLSKIAIKNDTTELISLLCELIEAIIEEQHVGNLGFKTHLSGDSKDKYQDILSRLTTLKI